MTKGTLLERIRPDLAAKRPPRKPAPEPVPEKWVPVWRRQDLRRDETGLA